MLFIPDIIPPFCEMFNDVRRKLSPIVRWLFCLIWGTRTIFIRLRNKRWESALLWQHSEVFTDSADFSIVVRLWRVFLFRRASSPCVLRTSVWESTRALLSLSFLRYLEAISVFIALRLWFEVSRFCCLTHLLQSRWQ